MDCGWRMVKPDAVGRGAEGIWWRSWLVNEYVPDLGSPSKKLSLLAEAKVSQLFLREHRYQIGSVLRRMSMRPHERVTPALEWSIAPMQRLQWLIV